jgi:signal transduction histidine kinase
MSDDKRFVQLVALACHDLRTPLATVSGFATTLANTELEAPTDRYIEMIEAASAQLGELLDELTLLVRIEAGRFDPKLESVDSLELARAAAGELEEGRVEVGGGTGSTVRVPEKEMTRGLSQLARAASRHGGFDSVTLEVEGETLRLSPLTRMSAQVLLGEELRDLGAVAATMLIRSLGGSVEVEGEALVVRLPA